MAAHADPAADPLAELLQRHGMDEYYQLFRDSGFEELDDALRITDKDLTDLGVSKMGHRRKLLRIFADVLDHGGGCEEDPPPQPLEPAKGRTRSATGPVAGAGSPKISIRTHPRHHYGGNKVLVELIAAKLDTEPGKELHPYVKMSLARTFNMRGVPLEHTIVRSTTKDGALPAWGEKYEFPAHFSDGYYLVLEVKNKRGIGASERIGVVAIPTKFFLPFTDTTEVDNWFPLKVGAEAKAGEIHLRLSVPGGAPSQVGKAFKVTGVKMDTRKLIVHVIEAQVPPSEKSGPRSTYVKLRLPNRIEVVGETDTIRNSTNPQWNHCFEFFTEVKNTQYLLVKLKINKAVGNKTLGVTKIPLLFYLSLKERIVVDQWFPSRDEEGKEQGKVRVRLEVTARQKGEEGYLNTGRAKGYRKQAPARPSSPRVPRVAPPPAAAGTEQQAAAAEEEGEEEEEAEEGEEAEEDEEEEEGEEAEGAGAAARPRRKKPAAAAPEAEPVEEDEEAEEGEEAEEEEEHEAKTTSSCSRRGSAGVFHVDDHADDEWGHLLKEKPAAAAAAQPQPRAAAVPAAAEACVPPRRVRAGTATTRPHSRAVDDADDFQMGRLWRLHFDGLWRVRAKPSMSAKEVATLPNGSVIRCTEPVEGWLKLVDGSGWVAKRIKGEGWTAVDEEG